MPKYPIPRGLIIALAAATFVAAACGARSSESTAESEVGPLPTATAAPSVDSDTSVPDPPAADDAAPLAEAPAAAANFGTPLGTALDIPSAESDAARPVGFRYPDLGVASAPIEPVGVEANGEMEIPGAEAVGWYQYGPTPGEAGSAVLAAHIAYDGVDGVFRDLVRSEVDDVFTVVFDDGSEHDYVIVERAQYDKTALPFDRVFSRSGAPVVTLISCGGDFQSSLGSYQDNIVSYAVPVDSPGDAGS